MTDRVIRTFGSVRHIPYFQRNLFFVGMLDKARYTCKIKNGMMKISKREMSSNRLVDLFMLPYFPEEVELKEM